MQIIIHDHVRENFDAYRASELVPLLRGLASADFLGRTKRGANTVFFSKKENGDIVVLVNCKKVQTISDTIVPYDLYANIEIDDLRATVTYVSRW